MQTKPVELLTLYARYERSTEGHATARDKDVTLWRPARPGDFPHMTRKLVEEGPRLPDGTMLFPVARIPYYHTNRPTRRHRTTMLNCWKWRLVWLG